MPECVIGNVKIHIEVPLLLLSFAFVFSGSIQTNLIIFRTCYVTLGYNKSECALLGSTKVDNNTAELEKIVEPYAAVVNMVHSVVETAITSTICLFVGPWSDRFGRKPILLIPLIGQTLGFVLLAILAALEQLSPWYFLISIIPSCLTGGGSSYYTVILCYITDVTNGSNRGMRMTLFEAVLALGALCGIISSSYVLAATNYWTMFLISATCCFFSFVFTAVFVPESLPNTEIEGRFREFFQLTNVKDMITTTFKRRPNSHRCIVLTCLFMLALASLVSSGDASLFFLYVREKFNWSLQQYTLYGAALSVVWIAGSILSTYILHKLLKIPESVMIVIGFIYTFLGTLFMGLAQYDWEIYAAAATRALGGVLSPMARSLISKIIPNEEVGKIFALSIVSGSLVGMCGSPIFTGIYNATISTDAAIFNFVAAGFYLVEIAIAIWIVFVVGFGRNEGIYGEVINDVDDDEGRNYMAV